MLDCAALPALPAGQWDLGCGEQLVQALYDFVAEGELLFAPVIVAGELEFEAVDGEVPAVAVEGVLTFCQDGVADPGGDGVDGFDGQGLVGELVGDDGVELLFVGVVLTFLPLPFLSINQDSRRQ